MNHVAPHHASETHAAPPRGDGSHRPVVIALLLWFAAALAFAASGLVTIEHRAVVPILIGGLAAALVVAYRASDRVRAFARSVDLRILIAYHVVRAPIGAAFLWRAAQGELDPTFASVAGWGDIAAGLGAVVAAALVPLTTARRRRAVLAWNVVGLADIAIVIVTAQRILLFSDHPETMAGLLRFPGPMLMSFVVPLVIATHLLVFARLARLA